MVTAKSIRARRELARHGAELDGHDDEAHPRGLAREDAQERR